MALCSFLRSANWRKAPATPGQKDFIKKRWKKALSALDGEGEAVAQQRRIDALTKGEAANIITRLRHGAQARYEKKAKDLAKALATAEKERRRRAREDVKVGALAVE